MQNLLPEINLESDTLADSERSLRTEWLVTNGLGGYASSTVLGLNTRKYHGLLVSAFNPPVDRRVLLARLEEEIVLGDQVYRLWANEEESGIHGGGFRFLSGFSLKPFPSFRYSLNQQLQLNKTVFMPHEINASVVLYEVANASAKRPRISVAPVVNSRGFHSVTGRGDFQLGFRQLDSSHNVVVEPSNGLSTLLLFSKEGNFVASQGEWVESLYRIESQRGESSVDYNYKQGFFEFDAPPNETTQFSIVAVAGRNRAEAEDTLAVIRKSPTNVDGLFSAQLKREEGLLEDFRKRYADVEFEDWLKWVVLSADSFLVKRESAQSRSVIAGYHWFNDWGRDSLISLPGLTLVTGRFEDAKQILLTFTHYTSNGLVPNSFPDSPEGTPAYNTVDATLWFVNAVLQFLKYTGEFEFVRKKLWATLKSCVEQHVNGTLFGIRVDSDGLISHGSQLTWMDAAPNGMPITPRDGKAVEVQALWYNALKIMQQLAHSFNSEDESETYQRMADRAKQSFLEKFWNPQSTCLYDVVKGSNKDDSLRPNQVLAVSLDFTMLDPAKAQQVVETVQKQFLTPYGLRTLANSDPRYVGKYGGDRWHRDKSYHNGTVWPWLLGPFTTAFLKVKGNGAKWRNYAFESFLKPLFTEELYRAGLGSISEIFDGDEPHEPNGCIAQAWSVAEPLRAYFEDVLLKRPTFEQKVLGLV